MPFLLALALGALVQIAPVRDAAWAAGLQPGTTAHLPAGHYRGPWRLGKGVHLIASPGAVLEGGDPVLAIAGDNVTIESLTVRALPGGVGIAALDAFSMVLRDVNVSGGARGVKLRGGALFWTGGECEGSTQFGVWLDGGRAVLHKLRLRNHQGPAIFLGHVNAELRDVAITDSEYGLLLYGSQLEMKSCRIERVSRTGLALVHTSGSIVDTVLEGPFSDSAISCQGARALVLRGDKIQKAGSMGIKLVDSHVTLSKNEISGARSDAQGLEGDGIYANNSRIDSDGDRLTDNAGVAVSIMGGSATFKACRIQGAGQAAAAVASQGMLLLKGCGISDGSTELVVAPESTLQNE